MGTTRGRRLAALVLLLSLLLAYPAAADVISVPPNDFFTEHEAACEYTYRWYRLNSPKGYVNLRQSPGGKVIRQEKNGVKVLVEALYQDWALTSCIDGQDISWLEAWVPLAELSVIYDEISFTEDCGDQFIPCRRETAEALLAGWEEGFLVYWPYPNAEKALFVCQMTEESAERLAQRITCLYTDPEGYVWGCSSHDWFCLSAPAAGDGYLLLHQPDGSSTPYEAPRVVSLREPPEIALYPAKEPKPPLSNALPALLTAAAVLLSAAALWFFRGRKEPGRQRTWCVRLATPLLVLLVLSLIPLALSDVLRVSDQPPDTFFQRHQEACEDHRQYYLINSPSGFLNLRSAPGGSVIRPMENGSEVCVHALYRGWGLVYLLPDEGPLSPIEGWLPMAGLSRLYDNRAFCQEFGDQLLPGRASVTGPLLEAYIQSGRTALVIWPYPNAPQAAYVYEEAPRRLAKLLEDGFEKVFTDEEGHLWGFHGYQQGGSFNRYWVLIDDPGAGDGVYALSDDAESGVGPRIVSVRAAPETPLYPPRKSRPLLSIALSALWAAALLGTGALWFLYGKKRNKGGPP